MNTRKILEKFARGDNGPAEIFQSNFRSDSSLWFSHTLDRKHENTIGEKNVSFSTREFFINKFPFESIISLILSQHIIYCSLIGEKSKVFFSDEKLIELQHMKFSLENIWIVFHQKKHIHTFIDESQNTHTKQIFCLRKFHFKIKFFLISKCFVLLIFVISVLFSFEEIEIEILWRIYLTIVSINWDAVSFDFTFNSTTQWILWSSHPF